MDQILLDQFLMDQLLIEFSIGPVLLDQFSGIVHILVTRTPTVIVVLRD